MNCDFVVGGYVHAAIVGGMAGSSVGKCVYNQNCHASAWLAWDVGDVVLGVCFRIWRGV